MNYSPSVAISETLGSIGSALYLDVVDAMGVPVTVFPKEFTLTVDFKNFDISKYKLDSISIYSSSDGNTWLKEDTVVDFTNKVATSNLNLASYFALVGERLDRVPPTTGALLSGEEGESGWFRSNVLVTLNAEDNKEGSGVYYIGYKLDDNYFQEYEEPFCRF